MGKRDTFLLLTALTITLTACTDEVVTQYGQKDRQGLIIAFTPSSPALQADTRAAQLTEANITSFGVSASCYESGTYATAGCGSYFFKQQVLTAIGSSGKAWPGADRTLSFFAYAPYSNLIGIQSAEAEGRPVYTYTVPSDITSQVDFMTAETLEVNGEETDTPVPLSFSHRLADIRFHIYNEGEEDITVHSIGMYGLRYTGTFTDNGWTLSETVNTTSVNPFKLDLGNKADTDDGITVEPDETSTEVTGSNDHFMMMPQTVPADTRMISVDATVLGIRQYFHYVLGSSLVLQAGKSYNIRLTLGYNDMKAGMTTVTDWTEESDTSEARPRQREDGSVYTEIDGWSEQSDTSGIPPRSREEAEPETTGITDWTEQDG